MAPSGFNVTAFMAFFPGQSVASVCRAAGRLEDGLSILRAANVPTGRIKSKYKFIYIISIGYILTG